LLRRYTKVHNELTLLKVDGDKNGNKHWNCYWTFGRN
jgi:hypothetical protein